ncbi:MAG: hypothetical protein J5518_03390 [Lachnospiraceae bacterium]|nr:hypothetical protein [Lachnospiraceae bacterium]
MEIADKIDWRRVKSVSMLCTVSKVYRYNERYDESREILLLAYDRYPESRTIVYDLCELSIVMNDVVSAVEYYKQYMRIAPDDTNSYILLYKIYEAQDVTLEERIQVLEEFKKRDYKEQWAYELAYLYHKTGQQSKCIAECDELILWFGEGEYVRKAMELKMEHTDLTPEQRRKYEGRPKQQIVEGYGQPIQGPYDPQQAYGYPNYPAQDLYGQNGYVAPQYNQPDYGENIQVQPVNPGKYSTMNLQEELARSMEAFMAQQGQDMQGPYYGQTSALYEPAEAENPYANPYGNAYETSFSQQNDISRQMYEQGTYEPVISSEPTGPVGPVMPQQEQFVQQPVQAMPQQAQAMPQQPQPMPQQAQPRELDVISTGKKFESILQQEYDGQISLSLPDTEMVERQITGQINLDDILNGFEDRKRETEQKQEEERRQERERRRAEQRQSMNETGDILTQLAGVIPGSTAGTLPSGRILTLEEEYGGNLSKIREEDSRAMEEAAKEASQVTGPIPDPLPEAGQEMPAEETVPAEEPVFIPEQTEEVMTEPVAEAAEPATVPDAEPAPEPFVQNTEEMPAEETVPAEEPVFIPEQTEEVMAEPVAEAAEPAPGPFMQNTQEMPPADMQDPMAVYEGMDFGEVEEIEDIEQPEDLDDMLKTGNMPIADIERIARANYEAGIEAEEEEPKRRNHPSYMTLEEAVHSRREFNESEQHIFVRFEGIESLKAQIVDAMDALSMEAHHGNVIVTGADNSGRKSLALDIVKAIQNRDSVFSGKVAKISGEALNKKNIPITIKKLRNGALIVENAGGLTLESVNIITDALRQETEPVLVVLEGSGESMLPIIHGSRYMPEVFDARIDIAPYTNDDLVAYGKGYAKEQEYSIDEMGMLALYTRIGEMQSLEHQVSIDEVREIVDAAIKHVDRKNMAHFMDVLLAKRYDDDDYIVLREKDFIN